MHTKYIVIIGIISQDLLFVNLAACKNAYFRYEYDDTFANTTVPSLRAGYMLLPDTTECAYCEIFVIFIEMG